MIQIAAAKKIDLRGEVHFFELVETEDAWYGGSGAFNEGALGFAARRPAGGLFTDASLGTEFDLALAYKVRPGLKIDLGASYFDGGDGADSFLTFDDDGFWAYLQLAWTL